MLSLGAWRSQIWVCVAGLGELRRQFWHLVHGVRAAKPSRGVGPRRDLRLLARGPQGHGERLQIWLSGQQRIFLSPLIDLVG